MSGRIYLVSPTFKQENLMKQDIKTKQNINRTAMAHVFLVLLILGMFIYSVIKQAGM